MPRAAGEQHALGQRGAQAARQRAGIEAVGRRLEPVRRRVEDGPGRRGPQARPCEPGGPPAPR